MSNLQAALRAMNGVGLSLAEVVARINTLIHDNTPDDLFITLFVALYDPATATLSYVNAGHDPPLVCAYDGNVTRLPATGLLVGVFPGAMYDQRVLHLNPGDLVLFYTDGATEAMNDEEEELGDDRLARMVADNRSAPVAALLTAIEDGVKAFHGHTAVECGGVRRCFLRKGAGVGQRRPASAGGRERRHAPRRIGKTSNPRIRLRWYA
jgi:sigma-B regulation protein RsbU (phosphoserine phosphatase)